MNNKSAITDKKYRCTPFYCTLRLLHSTDVMCYENWRQNPPQAKRWQLALLQRSGTETAKSLRYACSALRLPRTHNLVDYFFKKTFYIILLEHPRKVKGWTSIGETFYHLKTTTSISSFFYIVISNTYLHSSVVLLVYRNWNDISILPYNNHVMFGFFDFFSSLAV